MNTPNAPKRAKFSMPVEDVTHPNFVEQATAAVSDEMDDDAGVGNEHAKAAPAGEFRQQKRKYSPIDNENDDEKFNDDNEQHRHAREVRPESIYHDDGGDDELDGDDTNQNGDDTRLDGDDGVDGEHDSSNHNGNTFGKSLHEVLKQATQDLRLVLRQAPGTNVTVNDEVFHHELRRLDVAKTVVVELKTALLGQLHFECQTLAEQLASNFRAAECAVNKYVNCLTVELDRSAKEVTKARKSCAWHRDFDDRIQALPFVAEAVASAAAAGGGGPGHRTVEDGTDRA